MNARAHGPSTSVTAAEALARYKRRGDVAAYPANDAGVRAMRTTDRDLEQDTSSHRCRPRASFNAFLQPDGSHLPCAAPRAWRQSQSPFPSQQPKRNAGARAPSVPAAHPPALCPPPAPQGETTRGSLVRHVHTSTPAPPRPRSPADGTADGQSPPLRLVFGTQ